MEDAVFLTAGGERAGKNGPIPLDEEVLSRTVTRYRNYAQWLARRYVGHRLQALTRCGVIFEEVAREWLQEQQLVLDPRRVLYYYSRNGSASSLSAVTRELDCVCVDASGEPKYIVEVRLSSQGMPAVYRKEFQLKQSVSIAKKRWPNIKPVLLFIKVGPERVVSNPPGLLHGKKLRHDTLAAAFRQVEVPRVVLSFDWIWDFAAQRGWVLNPWLFYKSLGFAYERTLRRCVRLGKKGEFEHGFIFGSGI